MSDRAKDGERQLVLDHIDLVAACVDRLRVMWPPHVDVAELMSAGMLGLVEAAKRYDPAQAIPFEAYARRRVRGAVLDAARALDWAPRSLRRRSRELERARVELGSRLGRTPTNGEMANHLGIGTAEVARIRASEARSNLLSLEQPATGPENEGRSILDTLVSAEEPDTAVEAAEMAAYLRAALAHLPEKHRLVLVGTFFEGLDGRAVAERLGVTPSRVSQLRLEALELLRGVLEREFGEAGAAAGGREVAGRKPSVRARRKQAKIDWLVRRVANTRRGVAVPVG